MDENIVILGQFFSVVELIKPITVNLFDEKGLLLITFSLDGYKALDDFLNDDKIIRIEYFNLTTLNIQIDTSDDPSPPSPGPTPPTPPTPQSFSIILNGKKQTGSEVSFYAPIAEGTKGQMLVSNGLNQAPSWTPFNGFYPTANGDVLSFIYTQP